MKQMTQQHDRELIELEKELKKGEKTVRHLEKALKEKEGEFKTQLKFKENAIENLQADNEKLKEDCKQALERTISAEAQGK